jgi:hypothetical protein
MNTDTLQSKIILQETEALICLFRRWTQAFEHFELVINASVEENYNYKSTWFALVQQNTVYMIRLRTTL